MPVELPIYLTLLLAALSPWWLALGRRSFLIVGSLLHLGVFWHFVTYLTKASGGAAAPASQSNHWFPSDLISWSFSGNAWSLLFGAMVTGVGLLIFLYSHGYFGDSPKAGRFFASLLAFEAAMLGVVLADDAVLLFLFWELTSVTSFFLIGFNHEDAKTRWNALQALLVTGLGGVAMLAGFLILGHEWGTLSLAGWRTEIANGAVPSFAPLALILLGAMTKSALFPFFFWLPNAMSAPTPVSGFLHSATMVKAGIYLIGAVHPLLATSKPLMETLVLAGGITALAGLVLGWIQTDLKKILAYTTLSVLGMLALLLGLGSPEALKAAVLVMLGHACYKAGLFMAVGAVDKATGTREIRELGGLRHALAWLAGSCLFLALSKSGFPPLLGFLGKEYVYKYGFAGSGLTYALLVFLFLINVGLMALALRVALTPFRGPAVRSGDSIKRPGALMLAGPLIMAVAGLFLGLSAPWLLSPAVSSAVSQIHGKEVEFSLKLWHGVNPAFLLSLLTLLAGTVLYRLFPEVGRPNFLDRIFHGFERIYEACYHGLMTGSAAVSRRMQNGDLRSYLRWFFASVLVLSGVKWWMSGYRVVSWPPGSADIPWAEWALVPVIAVFLWKTITTGSRIFALLCLAVVGLAVAFVFARLGAPDVALTLLLVETFTVILFIRLVSGLPGLRVISAARERVVDMILAGGMGLLMALLALKVSTVQTNSPISATLSEWSYPLAKGKNIVNVILVDFRALDTLGEITVIVIAAVGVRLLWKRGRGTEHKEKGEPTS